jgi:hypothetical protein
MRVSRPRRDIHLLALSLAISLYVERKYGGASRARTDGLVVANDALSQLSYSPTKRTYDSTAMLFYQRLVIRHHDPHQFRGENHPQ